jgi:hypothetical protein
MLEVETRNADPADVASINAIIRATYDVISGPAGKKRDWNRERALFYPGARLIPTASIPGRNDVDLQPQILDVEGYMARAEPLLRKLAFTKRRLPVVLSRSGESRICGVHTSHATILMMRNRSCAESTAFSCSTMRVVGGS